jgi:hypothetical protein
LERSGFLGILRMQNMKNREMCIIYCVCAVVS